MLVLIIVDNHCSITDYTSGSSTGDSSIAQGSNARSLGVGSHLSFAVRQPGVSSSGGVGEDNSVGSFVDSTTGVDQSDEGSVRAMQDLEKGEVGFLTCDAAFSSQK